jgi:hypothetical protein
MKDVIIDESKNIIIKIETDKIIAEINKIFTEKENISFEAKEVT